MKNKSKITVMVVIFFITINLNSTYNFSSANASDNFPLSSNDIEIVNALNYLRNQQNEDGSIAGVSVTAWAAIAISAAEENPQNWDNLVGYLEEKTSALDSNKATDWERQLLAIIACNENPKDFAGVDFVEKIKGFYDGNQIGSPANLYDDFFGILSLISAGVKKNNYIIENTKSFIIQEQKSNGGWGDADSTSAAIMALVSAGQDTNSKVIRDAISFLKTLQTSSGGFHSWGKTNIASTSWAVMAITATGENPTHGNWENNGENPIDYILSLQKDDGSFYWAIDQNNMPEWMTSYAITALVGSYLPVKIRESEDEENNPPNTPKKPTGPVTGIKGVMYSFKVSSIDPENDKVQYRFDWDANGNHDYSSWSKLGSSGHQKTITNTWSRTGKFVVEAQARDEHGLKSSWSDGLEITISDNSNDGNFEWNGRIRIEGKEDTIWNGKVNVKESIISVKNINNGEMEKFYLSYPSVLGALEQASKVGNFSYKVEYYSDLDKIKIKNISNDELNWFCWVDYGKSITDIYNYKLSDNDDEIILGCLNKESAHALKIWIEKTEVDKDNQLIIKVFDEKDTSVEEASIYFNSKKYATDINGSVTIELSENGNCILYAEKEGFVRSEKIKVKIKSDIQIIKPKNKSLYFCNFKIKNNLKNTLIIGPIIFKLETTEDVKKIEFYVDDKLAHTDESRPFEFKLNKRSFFKKINVTIKSYIHQYIKSDILKALEKIKQLLEKNDINSIYDVLKNLLDECKSKNLILGDIISEEFLILNSFPRLHILSNL